MIKTNSLFIVKKETHCCSFAQMIATNATPLKDIQDFIKDVKMKSENVTEFHTERDSNGIASCAGQRGYFCMTTPSEAKLEENLKQAGFEYITSFKRRYCYADHETAELKMWVIKW